jgi:subtilisin family serine protease
MRKQLSIALVVIATLAMALPVASQGPGDPDVVGPLSVESTLLGAAKEGLQSASALPSATQKEGNAATDLKIVSIIVTFEDWVEPADLEAVGKGQVIYRYKKVFNGASMVLPDDNVGAVASMRGVKRVFLDELVELDTDESPAFVGAPVLWEALGGQEVAGEGVVVGVIDSGIWPEHPSFSDPDPSGKPYAAPPFLPGHNGFTGAPRSTCDFGNTAWNPNDAPFTCNNKLIGAYRFQDTAEYLGSLTAAEFKSARDSDGHGTHTASTAAGNAGVEASILGTSFGTISGIAPRAHVIMYRTAWGPNGTSYYSDLTAAVEQAALDGVDALNYSIGGGSDPFNEAPSLAFLAAYKNGVFVSCSAGNDGPDPDTVGHRCPWTTTVGASTQSRTFEGYIHIEANNTDTLDLVGVSIGGDAAGELVLGADYGDALCGSADGVNPFPPGTFTSDQIVVCQRGIVARVEKSGNVMVGGAGGMILYNPAVQTLNADNHFVPTVHIDDVAGQTLLDFMASHTGETVALTGGVKVFGQGDVMAAFSSRGGPGQALGISKPDITAPGVNILAGHSPMPAFPFVGGGGAPGNLFQAIGGTSMSAPHIAGAAALLSQMHPDWTPGQIKSALMMTAWTDGVVKEDGVTPADPFDYGSGRLDLTKAGDVGVTISATGADFVDLQDELWHANYPSLYVPVMAGQVTVQRTLHGELAKNAVWMTSVDAPPDVTVDVPTTILVKAGQDATFDITVDARHVPLGQVRHATLYLSYKGSTLRFPITIVREQPPVTLEKTCDPAVLPEGDTTDCTITIQNTSFDEATVSLFDRAPPGLPIVPGSVDGADQRGASALSFEGTLYGAAFPEVTVGVGTAPYGYLPLAWIGAPPNVTHSDESCANFFVPPFVYAGETYGAIGMVSNGYAVVGGCTGSQDIDFINQVLPDPAPPNNVLAPFWTDLNPSAGGNYYAYTVGDGVNNWLVLEWEDAPNWGDGELNSFQIWIGLDGYEEINFTYGTTLSDGDGGWLTVGAENAYGNSGANYYVDGDGTLPAYGTDVGVTSVPGEPGETHTITYTATGEGTGPWSNCVEMTSDLFFGTSIVCFDGEVTD